MNLSKKNNYYFELFDHRFSSDQKLGITFEKDFINVRIWQPIAMKVKLIVFKFQSKKILLKEEMTKNGSCWESNIDLSLEGNSYVFQITHPDATSTFALDPYAVSLEPFDWKGDTSKIGRGVLLNIYSEKLKINNLVNNSENYNNVSDPLIYELHIRDFTTGLKQENFKNKIGTFNAALENNIFQYLSDLSISHLQLLPLHSIFTLNESNQEIVKKGDAKGWLTNYNWGYDPHNYFAISNWYSSNPSDPYQGILDFKNFVNKAHEKGIGVIVDVVYNHMMSNDILNNVLPGYYYRDDAKIKPVDLPPLASQRKMVRRLIIDSLIHWVKTYNVDGFRFDLSTFIDEKTLNLICEKLREIKPNIVLHGEAWKFSDLKFNRSFTKGVTSNDHDFAYFNDTLRNSIRGSEFDLNDQGLISKYSKKNFKKFTNSIVGCGNWYKFQKNIEYDNNKYDLFASNIGMTLNYIACHDGYTLWDKINVMFDVSIDEKINMYKQALLASVSCQGRYLLLAGTELLQSKPCDLSGKDGERSSVAKGIQLFDDQPDNNLFCENTYKTSDFVNCIKWNHLEKSQTKEVFDFCKKLFKFRQQTSFFRLSTNEEISKNILILLQNKGVIFYKIKIQEDSIIVMHNFTNKPYKTKGYSGYKLFLSSSNNLCKTILPPKTSQILIKETNEKY